MAYATKSTLCTSRALTLVARGALVVLAATVPAVAGAAEPTDHAVPVFDDDRAAVVAAGADPALLDGPDPVADARQPLPSLLGATGLLRISTTDVGAPRRLRLALHGEYTRSTNLVVERDRNQRLMGSLLVGYTPVRFLEIFGGIYGAANQNRRQCSTTAGGTMCASEPGRTDPEVLRSFGDLLIGTKFARPIGAGFSAGVEASLRFLSSPSGIAFDPSATSAWLGALLGYDLRDRAGLPLRLSAWGGYYLDNSSHLQAGAPVPSGFRAVSSFAYGIGRDRVRTALAVDAPLELAPGFVLQPMAEYHLNFVTGAADPAFAAYRSGDNRDQMSVTAGVRARLGGGLAVDAGVDVALRSPGISYGSVQPPLNAVVGLAYPLDLAALGRPRVVIRTVTVEKFVAVEKEPPPREGFVSGKIISTKDGVPVSGAMVAISGRGRARVATDSDGTFSTKGLPAGQVDLEISAPHFEPTLVRANVTLGGSTEISATLAPRVEKGRIQGRLIDEMGRGVAGVVKFTGPELAEAHADASGVFNVSLPPGSYGVRTDSRRFFTRELGVAVVEGSDRAWDVALRERPERPLIQVRKGRLLARRSPHFRTNGRAATDQITGESLPVLDELSDLLLNHPEIRRVRVEAHWDSKTGAAELTAQQANAVVAYLVRQGISADRLSAVGMGARKPLVPNIGGRIRAKNRRVEFHLDE